jgi:hypothetical protein
VGKKGAEGDFLCGDQMFALATSSQSAKKSSPV